MWDRVRVIRTSLVNAIATYKMSLWRRAHQRALLQLCLALDHKDLAGGCRKKARMVASCAQGASGRRARSYYLHRSVKLNGEAESHEAMAVRYERRYRHSSLNTTARLRGPRSVSSHTFGLA